MAASITAVTKVGPYFWKYEWTGTSPFRVYIPGKYIKSRPITDTELIVQSADDYEPPPLEVFDSTESDDASDVQYPSTLVLQWRGQDDAYYYTVEESVSSVWTHRRLIKEDGRGYYEVETPVLTDGTTAQWRVTTLDSQENESTVASYSLLVVRHPAPPSINMSYSAATGNVTVSAR